MGLPPFSKSKEYVFQKYITENPEIQPHSQSYAGYFPIPSKENKKIFPNTSLQSNKILL